MTESYEYLEKMGFKIIYDPDGPPGVEAENLKEVMEKHGLWEAFCDWSKGSTSGPNGAYPWDVDDFLSGRPNLD